MYIIVSNMTKKQIKKQQPSAEKSETKKQAVPPKKEEEKKPKTLLGVTLPVAPAPVEEAPKEPAYEPKPFDLSRKSGPKEQGLPKSKKPWKVLSERSAKHKKMNPKKWQY
jgi:hypothetical protein